MIVVGFNWPLEHDNSAAVIWDGKLVFVSEEETVSYTHLTLPTSDLV